MKLFKKKLDQNEELIKNIERYEKEKAKQQESKVLEQRKKRRTRNKKKSINVRT